MERHSKIIFPAALVFSASLTGLGLLLDPPLTILRGLGRILDRKSVV